MDCLGQFGWNREGLENASASVAPRSGHGEMRLIDQRSVSGLRAGGVPDGAKKAACLDGGKYTPSDVSGSSAPSALGINVVDAGNRPNDPYFQ
jgi:hypothetical protein